MLFNVPQFINMEDKIIGPFTAKQLGWMAIGGVILLVLWNTLTPFAFIVSGLIDVGLFGALAFYRPYNQPFSKFIISSLHFTFRPRIYVWKREYDNIKTAVKHSKHLAPKTPAKRKILTSQKIQKISRHLDSLNR